MMQLIVSPSGNKWYPPVPLDHHSSPQGQKRQVQIVVISSLGVQVFGGSVVLTNT